jgi:hypothetical protein
MGVSLLSRKCFLTLLSFLFLYQDIPRVNKEDLEEIRQQGLTKMLNKQFTEYAKMNEKDKVAYDAAVRDLEQRKANTSEFKFSGNVDLSPTDALCLAHSQWKSESRLNHREAMGYSRNEPDSGENPVSLYNDYWHTKAHADKKFTVRKSGTHSIQTVFPVWTNRFFNLSFSVRPKSRLKSLFLAPLPVLISLR